MDTQRGGEVHAYIYSGGGMFKHMLRQRGGSGSDKNENRQGETRVIRRRRERSRGIGVEKKEEKEGGKEDEGGDER